MNIFSRIWNIIVGRTSSVLDNIENPEDQLRLFVNNLDSEMSKLRQAVTAAITEEKKLKIKIENLLLQGQEWEKKAIFALNQGQEDLAKEALLRKTDADNDAMKLKEDWTRQLLAVEKLQQSLRDTQEKTEKAKRDYTVLLARYRSAKTQQKINNQLNSMTDASPNNMFDNINERIIKIEAETQADLQMIGSSSNPDLESNFAKLEKQIRGDEALKALKNKMGMAAAESRDVTATNPAKKIGNG